MKVTKEYYIYNLEVWSQFSEGGAWNPEEGFHGSHSGINFESAKVAKKEAEEECPGVVFRITRRLVQVGEPEVVPEAETVI